MITVPVAEAVEPAETRPLHVVTGRKTRVRPARVMMHIFLVSMALLWLIPIGTALYNSFRFYESDTQVNGVFAPPESLTLQNYRDAWSVGEMGHKFGNTAFIVLPALFLILLLSSMVAFACTRFSWRFNVFFLILFTAGNLMPHSSPLRSVGDIGASPSLSYCPGRWRTVRTGSRAACTCRRCPW